MALLAIGNWDEARKGVDAGLKAVQSPVFLYQDAVLRIRNHDIKGAQKSLESAVGLTPTDPGPLNLLGQVMRQQGESSQYTALVREAVAKNPKSAALENVLGNQLLRRGDRNGARAAFEAAKAAGDVVDADIEIASLDMRAGARDQAKQRLLNLVKTHDNTRARLLLAEIETSRGSPDAVIQDYLKALQLEPTNVLAMNNLAGFLTRQGKYDDALFWALKALALAPSNPVIEDTLGWIYYRQGKYDAAMPWLEKSLKGLNRPVAHYHLAAALVKTGDPVRGRKEYDVAVKQDPRSAARGSVAPLFEPHP
jgi:Tfp pilus assembly protein PilF